MGKTPTDPLLVELKRRDPERFATLLFAPSDKQAGLCALYAFNLELGSVRERAVREPSAGLIRLQWWRDALESERGDMPLAAQVSALGLDREALLGLVDAREADLSFEPPATLKDLEAYAAATGGALHALAARLLGAEPDSCRLAWKAGTAYALLGLMRAIPAHGALGRRHLPMDLFPGGIDRPSAELGRAVEEVAELAGEYLGRVRLSEIPRFARASALCALQARTHLKRLRRAGFDPFDRRLSIPATRLLAMAWGMI